ncbi:MAG: hypothetical protein M1830_010205 [Pleopsidium flavum]|nr:MAG: hypothetical protein M1830_010205 [Pleopsidium flavum]
MAEKPTPILLAQAIGITTSAMLSGGILSITLITVPSLLLSPPPLLARQWRLAYSIGSTIAPPLALLSSTAYTYLAWTLSSTPLTVNHPRGEWYAFAAAATVGVVPWTLGVMRGVNGLLKERAGRAEQAEGKGARGEIGKGEGEGEVEVEREGEEGTRSLLDRWGTLNLLRGLLPAVGTALGVWASLA